VTSLARVAHRVLGTRQVNQLVRFVPVLTALDTVPPGCVLDVGSGSTGIGPLLRAGWTVVALDADFADYGAVVTSGDSKRRVLGDVRRLPFADASFDAVVAVDLLEHVTPSGRSTAVDELCRVTKHRAVIACPTGEAAAQADKNIREALVTRHASVPPWLDEHIENGFPERADLLAIAAQHGTVDVEGNESARAHERITRAELRVATAVPLRVCARVLASGLRSRSALVRRAATGIVHRMGGRDREPTYRSVLCVDVDRRHSSEYSADSSATGHGR
jgi:SAM-dependent methyltransferase